MAIHPGAAWDDPTEPDNDGIGKSAHVAYLTDPGKGGGGKQAGLTDPTDSGKLGRGGGGNKGGGGNTSVRRGTGAAVGRGGGVEGGMVATGAAMSMGSSLPDPQIGFQQVAHPIMFGFGVRRSASFSRLRSPALSDRLNRVSRTHSIIDPTARSPTCITYNATAYPCSKPPAADTSNLTRGIHWKQYLGPCTCTPIS